MKRIKEYMGGQIGLPILLTMGSLLTGSVLWITNISFAQKEADAVLSERITKIETILPVIRDDTAEIKEDLRDIKNALRIK